MVPPSSACQFGEQGVSTSEAKYGFQRNILLRIAIYDCAHELYNEPGRMLDLLE